MNETRPPLPPLPERETLRLHQANERTLLAWVRTAIALMGLGFVVARFGVFLREVGAAHDTVPAFGGGPASLWLGVALAVGGAATTLGALANYHRVARAIERHEVGAPHAALTYAAGTIVAAVGIALAAILFATR